ncbi:S24/S26 family peptidase [Cellulomonas carbonis]|uniref:Peptidase n=1 Tax=Cellulomonas carbonis T26 TaxID=947969 RepID=A0A0A0BP24_9CELL|nr:S24/S26 family peptidase [Cellulomonas carbonis]KGM09691.1 peptidase [Cellulomonas carbonis T26]GGC05298.1 hypothetical protein GCM10010972_18060 [Cellulomonas carbonis]
MLRVAEQAGAARPRRLLGRAGDVVWVVAALVVGWFLWPSSLGGCTTLTIVSGRSMEPTYVTGDLVVARCGQPEVGDVVVYTPPGTGGARVIHRIVDGDPGAWVLQGDNNDFLDPWEPTDADVLGRAVLHLPGVGTAGAVLLSPLAWVSLLVVALAVLVWPDREADPADEEPDDAAPGGPPGDEPATVGIAGPPAMAVGDRVGAVHE